MNKTKLYRLTFLAIHISSGVLYAQTDFRAGYIIKNSADTLYGEIDYRGDLLMSSICKFKDKNNSVYEYSPKDIIAYRFTDSKYFVSREIDSKDVFLEYLIKGKVNIYYMRDGKGDHYYLNKEDLKLTELPYEEGVKLVGDKEIYFKSKEHIGILYYVMQDAPGFKSKIERIKKPNRQHLIKLAKDYHDVVCEGEKCIIYENKRSSFQINLELIGGMINYSNVESLNDKSYSLIGIIGHIWMPMTSEKLYFKTGVIVSRLNIDNQEINFYKIPIHLEYIFSKGIIRPRFAFGLNLYFPSAASVDLNFGTTIQLGTNIELSKTLFLSVTSDIEFNSKILMLPKNFLAYSLNLGFFVKI